MNHLFLDTLLLQPLLILRLQLGIDLRALRGSVAVQLSGLGRVLLAELGFGLEVLVVVVRGVRFLALGCEAVADGALVLFT